MSKRHKKIGSERAGRFVRVGRDLVTIALDERWWWRLLVPAADNDGLVFTDGHHLKLHRLVFKISDGSTENPWSNGKWMNNGRVYKDRVIPLEFLATTEGADKIAAFALVHYEQKEILWFRSATVCVVIVRPCQERDREWGWRENSEADNPERQRVDADRRGQWPGGIVKDWPGNGGWENRDHNKVVTRGERPFAREARSQVQI